MMFGGDMPTGQSDMLRDLFDSGWREREAERSRKFLNAIPSMKPRRIVTEHVYPAIPVRQFDWRAMFEGDDEETSRHGYGQTELKAVNALLLNVEEWVAHPDDADLIARALEP